MTSDYYFDWLNYTNNFFLHIYEESLLLYMVAIIIQGVIFYLTVQIFKKDIRNIKSLFLIYPLIYITLLFTSNTLFDFTPLYYRTLSPIYIFVILSITMYVFEKNYQFLGTKTLLLFAFLILSTNLFFWQIKHIDDGIEYSSKSVMIPSTIKAINSIPDNSIIYTNGVDRLYFLTNGRVSDWWKENLILTNKRYYIVCFKDSRNNKKMLLQFNKDSLNYSSQVLLDTKDVLIKLYEQKPI